MATSLYALILLLFYVRLTLNIVKLRTRHKISLGDGDNEDLRRAISAHNNASQYIPLGLLLLFLLESSGAHWLIIHLAGIVFLIGRYIHAKSIVDTDFKTRRLGMQLTLFTMVGLSALGVVYWVLSLLIFF